VAALVFTIAQSVMSHTSHVIDILPLKQLYRLLTSLDIRRMRAVTFKISFYLEVDENFPCKFRIYGFPTDSSYSSVTDSSKIKLSVRYYSSKAIILIAQPNSH